MSLSFNSFNLDVMQTDSARCKKKIRKFLEDSILCTFYFSIGNILSVLSSPIIESFLSHSWHFYVRSVNTIVLACNGITSPLIYVWQSQTFRRHIFIMYGLKKQGALPRSRTFSIQTVTYPETDVITSC